MDTMMKGGEREWEYHPQENGRDFIVGTGWYQARLKCQVSLGRLERQARRVSRSYSILSS